LSGECFVHVNRQRLCACACHARTPAVLCSCQAGACRCIDHQAFACLCMRGRGRKLVAIQTETHACQEQSLAVCRAGSVSATPLAQPPKSECECSAAKRRWCRTFLAIVLASCSNMTRARSAAVSLGSGLPRVGHMNKVKAVKGPEHHLHFVVPPRRVLCLCPRHFKAQVQL